MDKEKLTNELLDYLANKYITAKEEYESSKGKKYPYNLEQYIEIHLDIRVKKIESFDEVIING
ncbi:hypothetical protein PQE75_gp013 [Bacillus phage vB_BcoS-136]|uniref:Uncharacterized protein n=1 Tax=Bacillus phage vB_BcoS-136 TaxID=2419619 RepID=A0A3G3BV85_9CAUD|nr:hypothetical protein PQE75_gp013 [Bacillus phage vB_BcoS-136]AYP68145.1 hypothetical protein vBBcoS136_00013 [Bacillus phage vB_BcoS-136]